MNAKCADFYELLSALADGELPAADRARVEAHAAGCAECRKLLERFRKLDAAMVTKLVPPSVPAERWDRMLTDIKRAGRARQTAELKPAPARPLRVLAFALAAAAALALTVSLFFAGGPRSPEYSSAEIVAVEPSDGSSQTLLMAAPEGGLSLVIVSPSTGSDASEPGVGG